MDCIWTGISSFLKGKVLCFYYLNFFFGTSSQGQQDCWVGYGWVWLGEKLWREKNEKQKPLTLSVWPAVGERWQTFYLFWLEVSSISLGFFRGCLHCSVAKSRKVFKSTNFRHDSDWKGDRWRPVKSTNHYSSTTYKFHYVGKIVVFPKCLTWF